MFSILKKKRRGFTAVLEFMTCLIVLMIGAAAIPIALSVNKENYANQLVATLEMVASKTRMNQNVLDSYGIGDIVSTAQMKASADYPDMSISCTTTVTTGETQSCTISYEILWTTKSKTINFTDTYIGGGSLLGG